MPSHDPDATRQSNGGHYGDYYWRSGGSMGVIIIEIVLAFVFTFAGLTKLFGIKWQIGVRSV